MQDGDKSLIESLTSRVQDLDSSFSLWNRIGLALVAGTALVAMLYFIASYITNKKAQNLSAAQAALLKAKEDQFNLQIAALTNETALARKDAAEANEKAERERLARVKIEARLRLARRLSVEQLHALVERLNPFAGEPFWIVIESTVRDKGSEQAQFAEQLSGALVAAGWVKDSHRGADPKGGLPHFWEASTRGVEIGFPEGKAHEIKIAQTLAAALDEANVDAVVSPYRDMGTGLVISVGLR